MQRGKGRSGPYRKSGEIREMSGRKIHEAALVCLTRLSCEPRKTQTVKSDEGEVLSHSYGLVAGRDWNQIGAGCDVEKESES